MKKNILIFFSAFTIYLGVLGIMAFNYQSADSEQSSTDPHKEAECATCHKMVSSVNNTGYAITNQDCLKCHDPNKISSNLSSLNFHKDPTRNCLDCHSFHDKATIQAKGTNFKFNFDSPSMRMQCSSCHDESVNLGKISDAHRQAAAVYHNDSKYLMYLSPSESCMICHSKNSNYSNNSLDQMETPKFYEHATHPLGQRAVGYNIKSNIDPKIQLFEGNIECQTCHNLSSDKYKHLAYFEEEYDICLGCHNLNPRRK